MNKYYSSAKQICNYYQRRLKRAIEESYTEKEFKKIANLIDIYSEECQKEYLYLPSKKIRVREISDILYYEKLFGKEIYKKKEY